MLFHLHGSQAITNNPGIRSGQPILTGTRFPVAILLAELAEGEHTLDEIAEDYSLDPATCRLALEELARAFQRNQTAYTLRNGDQVGVLESTLEQFQVSAEHMERNLNTLKTRIEAFRLNLTEPLPLVDKNDSD